MKPLLALATALLLTACSGTDFVNTFTHGIGVEGVQTRTYGALERQQYDLYTPSDATAETPLVVFIYGGSWQKGDRGLYEFLGNAFAREDIEVAIIDYRVWPQVTFPAFVNDAAKAVATIERDVAGERPIVLMGHSAGAQIAALLNHDPSYLRGSGVARCERIAGFIGLAGPYDFLPLTKPNLKEVFPVATRAASQPVNFAGGSDPVALLIHGLDDEVVSPKDTRQMEAALRKAGNAVETRYYEGVNHTDIMGGMAPIVSFIAPTRDDVFPWVRQRAATAGPYC